MAENEVTYNKICRGQEMEQNIFTGFRNYTTALKVCQNVHGNLVQIETEAQQQEVVHLLKNSSICSNTGSWIGWWDDDQEGKWVSAQNSSVSLGKENFQSWGPSLPNGGTRYNCASIDKLGRYNSMTTLLTHTVAHSTKPSFMPKTNNQPPKKFLSLALS